MTYSGAGNVVGGVFSGVFDRSIAQRCTAGLQIRHPEQTSGIQTRWKGERLLPVLHSDPSMVAVIVLLTRRSWCCAERSEAMWSAHILASEQDALEQALAASLQGGE